ncbi:DUF2897 family protein [Glaciecola sp. XM2]|uniref:DUF2897 family protein n=1 Tax=Glaciecola sp. XM2 TaxID=1914931 RepID=UPI001BDDD986|nr:DUF2897 family protein [Glaciecola sp. XM2]MBT1449469.1 DUF2897 family protein [Glaciecola sp. XM2]
MSTMWIIIIIALVFGVIVGNIMLLKYTTRFDIPKDFKKRPDSDYDKEDEDKW